MIGFSIVGDYYLFFMSAPPTSFDANAIRGILSQKQWPNGLQEALIQSCEKFPVRFFVIDNSGSMIMNDGHYRVSDGVHTKSDEKRHPYFSIFNVTQVNFMLSLD